MGKINPEIISFYARAHNIPYEQMEHDIEICIFEKDLTWQGIETTISKNGYIRFPNDFKLFGYGANNELNDNYICYTPNMGVITECNKSDIAIVSGFGATNSPTAGTLSMILKLIKLQKATGLYTYLIINDLGTLNARNINAKLVLDLTEHFKDFVIKMGFDVKNGEIRTHNDIDHARTFSLVASMIKLDDFAENSEATDKSYDRMNLRGNDFSTLVDHVYTASDVLLPIIKDQKKAIIVSCGLEEFYHANIANIALQRLKQNGYTSELIPDNVAIGALYCKIIDGFFPYFKQSKSIPHSSVNLGDSAENIYHKIVESNEIDDGVILMMMCQASDFDSQKLNQLKSVYSIRQTNREAWINAKMDYYNWFLKVKEIWDSYQSTTKRNLRESIYNLK